MADESETAATADENAADDAPLPKAPNVKAMETALRKANKEAENARIKLKEYEDRDKSESERAAERIAAAEQRAIEAERSSLRLRIAANKNLPPKLADRLHGDTEDEMSADADELLAELGNRNGGTKVPAGPRNDQPTTETDMSSLIRERMRR